MNPLDKLFSLANYAGGRLDLVQASGGNVSLKVSSQEICVKISGIALSEMMTEEYVARLKTKDIVYFLENFSKEKIIEKKERETSAAEALKTFNLTSSCRP